MKTYKNGVHTPKETTELFNRLKNLGFKVEDWSWGNDEGDSIRFNNKATIWLPVNDDYKHFGYVPWLTTEKDDNNEDIVDEYDWDNQILFDTLEQLMDFLISRKRRENIEYLLKDYGLKELWNEDEFNDIPNFTNAELTELVAERKDFYNEI